MSKINKKEISSCKSFVFIFESVFQCKIHIRGGLSMFLIHGEYLATFVKTNVFGASALRSGLDMMPARVHRFEAFTKSPAPMSLIWLLPEVFSASKVRSS